MNVKDIFSKMNNILHSYKSTHDFSGENNHVFLVTPYTALCIKEHYESGPLRHVLEPLRYRGYRIWKLKGNNDRLVLFAEVHQAMNTGNLFEESPLWRYFKEKEVRKKMVIDYKKEWERLLKEHGNNGILDYGVAIKLGTIMRNQIHNTIEAREELMEEFIRARITTNISESKEQHHEVQIYINGLPRGRYLVSKLEFAAWCKKKEKGGK